MGDTVVRAGQIWKDADPRAPGRYLRVIKISSVGSDPVFAKCRRCNERGEAAYRWTGHRSSPKQIPYPPTRVSIARFKPGRSGYELFRDAEEVDDGR